MISHLFNSIIQEYKGIGLILNDSPEPWNIGFQDGVSPGYSGIIDLHDNIFFYLVVIAILVFWMLGSTIYYFNNVKSQITHKYLVHGTLIEVLWTIFPAIVLLAIAIPSFRLLYILDEVTLPTITIKVTGHQWYWSYEYSDYETESGEPIEYDSYMKPESDLEVGDYRLLEVDNPIVIPAETHVRFIITSSDVLHDFALPAAGVKMDAAPARLNQTSFEALREGSLFGQCSELCGPYHGFMPIEVKVTSVDEYLTWIDSLGIQTFILFNINKHFHKMKMVFKNFFFFNLALILLWVYYNFFFTSLGIVNNNNFVFFLAFLITTLLTSYTLSKFELSSNLFIKWLQITTFYSITVLFIYFIIFSTVVGYELYSNEIIECSSNNKDDDFYHLPKKLVDQAVNASMQVAGSVIPNIGAATAAGTVGVAIINATKGLPPAQRLAAVSATTFVTATSTQAGLRAGKAIADNFDLTEQIKKSPHSNPNIDRIPSPDIFINSPLEQSEVLTDSTSPLEILLSSISTISISVLILNLILLYIIFTRYVLLNNVEFISYLLGKFHFKKESIGKVISYLNKGVNFNNKYLFIMFILITILLLFFILLNIFFINELYTNIHNYVEVYNYINTDK